MVTSRPLGWGRDGSGADRSRTTGFREGFLKKPGGTAVVPVPKMGAGGAVGREGDPFPSLLLFFPPLALLLVFLLRDPTTPKGPLKPIGQFWEFHSQFCMLRRCLSSGVIVLFGWEYDK